MAAGKPARVSIKHLLQTVTATSQLPVPRHCAPRVGRLDFSPMSTLLEIEAAAEALSPEQKAELVRFLTARLSPAEPQPRKARLVREGNDVFLEAPPGAPPMTPENIKRMLEDWP